MKIIINKEKRKNIDIITLKAALNDYKNKNQKLIEYIKSIRCGQKELNASYEEEIMRIKNANKTLADKLRTQKDISRKYKDLLNKERSDMSIIQHIKEKFLYKFKFKNGSF